MTTGETLARAGRLCYTYSQLNTNVAEVRLQRASATEFRDAEA